MTTLPLLEGVLLRLARLPEADRFVLRGGLLLRMWFRPLRRFVGDLDLVATYPFDVEETRRLFLPVLGVEGIDDGVSFDTNRVRVDGIWLQSECPGVRIFATGRTDEVEQTFSIDITFGEPLVPEPVFGPYSTESGEHEAELWMCRPETIVGRKLHALLHMGMLHWRPKDLNDLRLLLTGTDIDEAELPAAIAASFSSRGYPVQDARTVLERPWWSSKTASAKWRDFVFESREMPVPRDLDKVVSEVAERLAPVLERLT